MAISAAARRAIGQLEGAVTDCRECLKGLLLPPFGTLHCVGLTAVAHLERERESAKLSLGACPVLCVHVFPMLRGGAVFCSFPFLSSMPPLMHTC